jgi:hypothetical protein
VTMPGGSSRTSTGACARLVHRPGGIGDGCLGGEEEGCGRDERADRSPEILSDARDLEAARPSQPLAEALKEEGGEGGVLHEPSEHALGYAVDERVLGRGDVEVGRLLGKEGALAEGLAPLEQLHHIAVARKLRGALPDQVEVAARRALLEDGGARGVADGFERRLDLCDLSSAEPIEGSMLLDEVDRFHPAPFGSPSVGDAGSGSHRPKYLQIGIFDMVSKPVIRR